MYGREGEVAVLFGMHFPDFPYPTLGRRCAQAPSRDVLNILVVLFVKQLTTAYVVRYRKYYGNNQVPRDQGIISVHTGYQSVFRPALNTLCESHLYLHEGVRFWYYAANNPGWLQKAADIHALDSNVYMLHSRDDPGPARITPSSGLYTAHLSAPLALWCLQTRCHSLFARGIILRNVDTTLDSS